MGECSQISFINPFPGEDAGRQGQCSLAAEQRPHRDAAYLHILVASINWEPGKTGTPQEATSAPEPDALGVASSASTDMPPVTNIS